MIGDTLPSYVFFYDLKTDNMYWGELNSLLDVLRVKGLRWETQDSTTLYFDIQRLVDNNNIDKIYNDTRLFCSRLSTIKSDQDLLDSLLPYCNISIECTEKGKNINLNPIKEGLGFKFAFKIGDFEKFKDSQHKGVPCSLPIDNGKLALTYQNEEIYTIKNIEKVQISPNKKRVPFEIFIPDANVSAGPFNFQLQNRGSFMVFQTEKEHLPWYVRIPIDTQARKSDIKFKFYSEFSNIEEYFKYLIFMKSLSEHKRIMLKNPIMKDRPVAEFTCETTPDVPNWEIEFFENLLCIEKYSKKKLDIPKAVTKDDFDNAYLFSNLFSTGEAKLPDMKLNFKMPGGHLKEHVATLSSKGKQLIFESTLEIELCGEIFKCEMKMIIDKALPDNVTEKLFNHPKEIQDEKEYSITYIAEKGSVSKVVLIKYIEETRDSRLL